MPPPKTKPTPAPPIHNWRPTDADEIERHPIFSNWHPSQRLPAELEKK